MRTPVDEAYGVAVDAATNDLPEAKGVTAPRRSRRKWSRQLSWDKENMRTVSCRLPRYEEERLHRCCKEAGISKHRLVRYMLRTWMEAWDGMGVAMHGKQ